MHLAAAVGVPVVAIFGSTNENETEPLRARPEALPHAIITTAVPCRPCMLRECPLDGHPCMEGIAVERVKAEVMRLIDSSRQ